MGGFGGRCGAESEGGSGAWYFVFFLKLNRPKCKFQDIMNKGDDGFWKFANFAICGLCAMIHEYGDKMINDRKIYGTDTVTADCMITAI